MGQGWGGETNGKDGIFKRISFLGGMGKKILRGGSMPHQPYFHPATLLKKKTMNTYANCGHKEHWQSFA